MGLLGEYMNGEAHGSIWDSWRIPLLLVFGVIAIVAGIFTHNGSAFYGGIAMVAVPVFFFVVDFGLWAYGQRRATRADGRSDES